MSKLEYESTVMKLVIMASTYYLCMQLMAVEDGGGERKTCDTKENNLQLLAKVCLLSFP